MIRNNNQLNNLHVFLSSKGLFFIVGFLFFVYQGFSQFSPKVSKRKINEMDLS